MRFEVFLALVTIGANLFWGEPSLRFEIVAYLLLFWAVYFVGIFGMKAFYERHLRPVPVKS
jgi:hypothetical protein